MKFLSSVESLNSLFQWGSLLLVAGTVAFGAGAILTSRLIDSKQKELIARLNKDTAEARLKLAELQAATDHLIPRKLSLGDGQKLIWYWTANDRVKGVNVIVEYAGEGDNEARAYSEQIARVLEISGALVNLRESKFSAGSGIEVFSPSLLSENKLADDLSKGLSAAEIKWTPGLTRDNPATTGIRINHKTYRWKQGQPDR